MYRKKYKKHPHLTVSKTYFGQFINSGYLVSLLIYIDNKEWEEFSNDNFKMFEPVDG
jgi:hypothetical protein